MKLILTTCAAALLATAAFAADPMAPPMEPATKPATTPANTAMPESCADMMARARAMTMPSDATKAQTVKDELAAADDAGDDATCRTHATNAISTLSGM
jgi:hypothetical protein